MVHEDDMRSAIGLFVLAALALIVCATIVATTARHRVQLHTSCEWESPFGHRTLSSMEAVTGKLEARAWLSFYTDILTEEHTRSK
jgi:hypothetical protein